MNRGVTIVPVECRDELARRLKERIDRRGPNECWLWKNKPNPFGYAPFRIHESSNRTTRAHRLVFMLAFSIVQLPRSLDVCHSCDNRACCNLTHLFLGTHAANVRDMVEKGRKRSACGSEHSSSKLTEEKVQVIRAFEGPAVELAKRFGISKEHVNRVRQGAVWRHVT